MKGSEAFAYCKLFWVFFEGKSTYCHGMHVKWKVNITGGGIVTFTSLYNWIYNSKKDIDISLMCTILHEIALGMHYLHSRKPMIIHRDLKSLNVLVTCLFQPLF
jgi:serine/threonine protein kinase